MRIIQCQSDRHSIEAVDPADSHFDPEVCSRHILVFGEKMQSKLSKQKVGVIAVGGLGQILVELLIRLYVGMIMAIDFDRVEKSNLNRLPGATVEDALNHLLKVELAARTATNFNPKQKFIAINGNFLDQECQEPFKDCDVLIVTADDDATRIAAFMFGLAHGIPVIDVGTGAVVKNGQLVSAGGQVVRIEPGAGFCPICAGYYDGVAQFPSLMDETELVRQQNQGYVQGLNVPEPQVYALNKMAASWGIWMYMRQVAGEELGFDGIAIDALNFETHTWTEKRQQPNNCPICGIDGLVFAGDGVELLTRPRKSPRVEGETLESGKTDEPTVTEVDDDSIRPKGDQGEK